MEKLFESLFSDQEGVFSESTQKSIMEAFDAKVLVVAEERSILATEAMDKSHTIMLQQLVESHNTKLKTELKSLEESIDTEHTEKVENLFVKLDEDRAHKLQGVKDYYEGLLNESVKTESDVLVEAVDKFLDTWLEEKVPTEFLEEAAKKDYSQDLLKKISNLVGINESVDSDIREGLTDARNLIDRQSKIIDDLKKDNFLRESTNKLPVLEKQQIMESFEGHDFEFTKRNFSFQQKQISKDKEASDRVVQEQTSSQNVDQSRVLNEQVGVDKEEEPKSVLAGWAEMLNSGYGVYGR
jgi:hypothetical protein